MRKKLFAMYALAGALVATPVFTSCVDSEESASVTALRGAKTEQLKSVAAMNNAEAQAKLIYANAEAQLKAAEAAQKQALADKEAALAKIEQLNAQLKEAAYDAELAAALAQAQETLAEAERNIAYWQGEMQKEAVSLETKLAELQKSLITQKENLSEAENAHLNALATAYSNALIAYTKAQNKLANLKTQKAALEAELIDLNVAKEKEIAQNEATIKVIDQQIAYLKEYENYAEDVEALKNEYTLKEAEKNKALDAANALYKKYEEANQAYNDNEELAAMLEAINENELVKMYTSFGYNNEEDKYVSFIYDTQEDVYDENGNHIGLTGHYINFRNYNPIFNITSESCKIEKEDYSTFYCYPKVIEAEAKDLRELALQIDDILAELDIKGLTESINKTETGLQAKYDAAVKATATAKAAYDAAKTDSDKEQAYKDALALENTALQALTDAKDALTKAEENKAELDRLYALVSTDTAKLLEEVEAYNKAKHDALTAVAEEYWAYEDANAVVTDIQTELTAMDATLYGMAEYEVSLYDYILNNINYNLNDSWAWISGYVNFNVNEYGYDTNGNYMSHNYNQNIWVDLNYFNLKQYTSTDLQGADTIQDLIDALETEKEDLLAENEDLSEITSKEQAIAKKEAKITAKEAEIAVLEVQVKNTKAALDAALPATEEEA